MRSLQLEPDEDYTGLARYITKENVKQYEKDGLPVEIWYSQEFLWKN